MQPLSVAQHELTVLVHAPAAEYTTTLSTDHAEVPKPPPAVMLRCISPVHTKYHKIAILVSAKQLPYASTATAWAAEFC